MYRIESKYFKVFVLSFLLLLLSIGLLSTSAFATTTGSATLMKVTSETTNYNVGQEFYVDVEIENPENYYAGDISIAYDDNLFQLKAVGVGNWSQLKIYNRTDSTTSGATRVIVASKGAEYGMVSDQSVLRLNFVALKEGHGGYIRVTNATVANGYGEEFSLDTYGMFINVVGKVFADINNDGRVSIGDVAIASRMIGASDWENYRPDVNYDGVVSDNDLREIVKALLNT